MAQTLTGLLPNLFAALDRVSRESIGFIGAVTVDGQIARAAQGVAVTSPVTTPGTATDITPGQLPPNDGAGVTNSVSVSITKSRRVPITWTGEEELGVSGNPSANANRIRTDQIAQAIRTLTNEVEADLAALHIKSSNAYGTPGTLPFSGSDLFDLTETRRLLVDNGAPQSDLGLIINTNAGSKLRAHGLVSNVSSAGDSTTRRSGQLVDQFGMSIYESAQVKTHTKGTGSAYTTSGTALPVGTTAIPLITGSGTVVAGDAVTFAGDSNKYLVASGVSAPGTITLAAPGLKQAIPAAATAMTILAGGVRNVGLARSALVMASRLPARPEGGDSAIDSMTVVDPISRLVFELSIYPGYRQLQYEVAMSWGAQTVKPEHQVILFG